jgi:dihydrofolate reductase
MGKLIVFIMVSLDGFFEGPDHELDWHVTDEEFDLFAIEQLRQIGTILFGRKTYQMMADYWPTQSAIKDDPVVAELMNSLPKVVFSTTLKSVNWMNSSLVQGDSGKAVQKMKNSADEDLILFGSAELMNFLIKRNLVDEIRLMINPVVLGRGHPLFSDPDQRLRLILLNARPFKSGNVLLNYEVAKG